MAGERFDIVCPRAGKDGKTYFTKIGVMWPMKSGNGFSISFEALPIPSLNDGVLEVRALAMPPKPQDGQRQGSGGSGGRGPALADLDDEVPF
jgi:hypothetical protein